MLYADVSEHCLFHLHRRVGMKYDWIEKSWSISTRKGLARKFSSQTFSCINTPTFLNPVILHTYPPMKMEQSVPKRRHIIFEPNLFLYKYSNFSQSSHTSYLPAYEDGRNRVCPKRRHITFRRRGITQKKAHNVIQVYVGLLISLKAQRLSCFAAESTSLWWL